MDGDDRTFHMFNNEVFYKVKRRCWLINSSRGEVVETEALKNALSGERIEGAVLDVWEREPEIDIPLMHMAFLATPHIAGYSADGKANGTAMIVKNLCASLTFLLPAGILLRFLVPRTLYLQLTAPEKPAREIVRKAVKSHI